MSSVAGQYLPHEKLRIAAVIGGEYSPFVVAERVFVVRGSLHVRRRLHPGRRLYAVGRTTALYDDADRLPAFRGFHGLVRILDAAVLGRLAVDWVCRHGVEKAMHRVHGGGVE